ncbi:unnamed protein product [Dibothriocephalus latus]|uniref:Uncharacterized protein n=1 Tax=Dibothriocephalus latus TaxID=60516 RepID=A0A3P6T107_DIBLA|nr:unnamed protein product [Dibothriocephalus latus]
MTTVNQGADLGKPANPSPKRRDQPSLRSRAQKLLKSQQYNCSADRYFAQLGPKSSRAGRPAPEDEATCCCCYVCGSARTDKNRRTVDERKSTWTRSRSYGPYSQEATRESARQGHGDVQHNAAGEAHCENDTMLLANKLRLSMRKLQKSAENLLERVRSSSRDPPLPPALPSQKGVRDVAKSHHHHHHHHHHREHRHHHRAAMGDPPRDPTATRRHHSLPVHSPREDLDVPAVPTTEQEGHYDSKSRQRSEEPIENQNNLLMGGSYGHLFSRQDPGYTVYERQEEAWIRPQLDGHSDTSDESNDAVGLEVDGSSASCPRQTFAAQTAFAWDTESEEGVSPLGTKKQSDLHCLQNYDDANCE